MSQRRASLFIAACLGFKRQAAVKKKKMKVVEITFRYFQIPLQFFFCTCRLVCFGDRCALCSLKRVSPLGYSGSRENWLAEAGLPSAFVFFSRKARTGERSAAIRTPAFLCFVRLVSRLVRPVVVLRAVGSSLLAALLIARPRERQRTLLRLKIKVKTRPSVIDSLDRRV